LTLGLDVSSLVKELGNGLSVRISVSDIRVDVLEHVESGLVDSDK